MGYGVDSGGGGRMVCMGFVWMDGVWITSAWMGGVWTVDVEMGDMWMEPDIILWEHDV